MTNVYKDVLTMKEQDSSMNLKAQVYGTAQRRGLVKNIDTRTNRTGRRTHLEAIMAGNRLQPYIHHTRVEVKHRKKVYQYHLFCKNHKKLQVNQAVQALTKGKVEWKGDIVVMKQGKTPEREVVSVTPKDHAIVDFAVRR